MPVGISSGSESIGSSNACSAAIRPCSIAVAARPAAGDVADGEYVRDRRCGIAVDREAAALVRLQPGLFNPSPSVAPWRPVA